MAHRTTSARSKSTVIVGERSLDVADLEVIELEGLTAKDPAEIAKLLKAAESQGFFYVSFDNSLSKKISEFLRISYLNSHEFFSKPLDEKMKAFREDVNYGYKRAGMESFGIFRDEQDSMSLPSPFAEHAVATLEFLNVCDNIVRTCLHRFSDSLGRGDIDNAHHPDGKSDSEIKFVSYPTKASAADAPDTTHTDSGSITLLWCEKWASQMQTKETKEWLWIDPKPDHVLVNIGNYLQGQTGGRLHSPVHRVVPSRIQDRRGQHLLRPPIAIPLEKTDTEHPFQIPPSMLSPANVEPSLDVAREVVAKSQNSQYPPNVLPLTASIPADLITPTVAYLKIAAKSKPSFLYESAATTETIGRYSFFGAVIKTGLGHGPECDPLPILEKELSEVRSATIPGLKLPAVTGGAIGYVGYDCARYFEPKIARPLKDVLGIPESLFMLFDTTFAFDHFFQIIKVITYIPITDGGANLEEAYQKGKETIQDAINTLLHPDIPLPPQDPILQNQEYKSNIGQAGYESHVTRLKEHIKVGDIFQAVPSQRLARPTSIHPFNLFRHLRTVNPSPYLFYVDCGDFQLVGASPELLVKNENGRIITHPIAGTVKRGRTSEEDEALAAELRNSLKDRAEHVMLVDLARNDVNRVCDPVTTQVDRLMVVEKFSHVQHLVSQVSGVLRPDKTRFDAFRSIFPAGTVSGAPKVRAMQLIGELEGEKRGVYAGAVGYFGFDRSNQDGSSKITGDMDTCIALRTMVLKDGVAYLQAGGGIVLDSDEYDEYVETLNKLGANIACIKGAEKKYLLLEKEAAAAK
ncbi:uncharacterized protein BHQ10_001568 [Talaromyces amestolkiae]|uniref:Anthranilate synthase n=1 Tax=Talaromyces amestolkiae TaxID=1196081 RepID=A0A364KPS1_TALAM|nr:uncharacterized protein BHQ10_001568 [Talaromyces amestolkiae]RAO65556.1 hypothetical protein BHQ10_001568 [Talaromyces amestolkiae]